MISFHKGNLLNEYNTVEAIVNTVNCVGAMGKGIALTFKEKFPDNYVFYKNKCEENEVSPGKMLVFNTKNEITKYIINFPTKKHWRNPSKIEYIEEGLEALIETIIKNNIKSVAIPALGCGNGNLDWNIVKPIIIKKIEFLTDVEFKIYEPFNEVRKNKSNKPRLSKERKVLLLLMDYYNNSLFQQKVTYIEVNQLAFLLSAFDKKIKLSFQLKRFGPMSNDVSTMLLNLSNHYLNVEKADNLPTTIELQKKSISDASKLKKDDAYLKVKELIKGFEFEDGLMILTVAYWLYKIESIPLNDLEKKITDWCKAYNHEIKKDIINKSINRIMSNISSVEYLSFDL